MHRMTELVQAQVRRSAQSPVRQESIAFKEAAHAVAAF
jgi:hypothetical protein